MKDSEVWNARQHDVVTGRTRKGRTTQRVTSFGAAVVSGALDCDVNGRPLLATTTSEHHLHASGAAARLLLKASEREVVGADGVTRPEITRRRHGLDALTIGRICQQAYGDLIPPVLNGTDVRQYEQVIHRDRAAQAGNVSHVTDIGGGESHEIGTMWISGYVDAQGAQTSRVVRDTTVAEIFGPDAANVGQTDTHVTWLTRGTSGTMQHGRLAHEPRESDPKSRRVFRVAPDGTCERVVIVVTGAADVVGLPTSSQVAHPTVAPRWDWTRRHGRTVLAATGVYGPRGIVADGVRVLLPGVASVTDHQGREITRTISTPPTATEVDRVWNGHETCDRLPAIVKTTDVLEQRTTVTAADVALPTSAGAWQALIERLAPGDRADMGDITITHTRRGDYYCATVRGDTPAHHRARTARGLAALLAPAA